MELLVTRSRLYLWNECYSVWSLAKSNSFGTRVNLGGALSRLHRQSSGLTIEFGCTREDIQLPITQEFTKENPLLWSLHLISWFTRLTQRFFHKFGIACLSKSASVNEGFQRWLRDTNVEFLGIQTRISQQTIETFLSDSPFALEPQEFPVMSLFSWTTLSSGSWHHLVFTVSAINRRNVGILSLINSW